MIKFTNILDEFRYQIYINLKPGNNEDDTYYEEVFDKIENIKAVNKIYRAFVTILFLDDYKIKYRYLIKDVIQDDEREILNYYDDNIKNVDDIIDYIEESGNIISMLNSTLLFASRSKNEKRELLNNCKEQNKFLQSVSKFHTIDLFYYAFPYTASDLIDLFYINKKDKALDARIEAKLEFSKILRDLYMSDKENYESIIDELITAYQVMDYHKLFEDQSILELLENKQEDIYDKIYSVSLLRQKLLDYYLEYNLMCSKEQQQNFYKVYKKNLEG